MKKVLLSASLAVMIFFGTFLGAQAATEQDAKAFAQKVVLFIKDNGLEKGKAELMSPTSQFKRAGFLVNVSDFNGVLLAHNTYPALAGQNHMELRDSTGKYFIKDGVEIARKGGGWMNFMWTNPDTKKVQPSKGWIQNVPGMDVWVMVTIGTQKQ